VSSLEVLRKAKRKVHACEISTGTVHVMSLSSPGRVAYMEMVTKNGGKSPPMHEIAALGLVDEDGKLCYDLSAEADRAALAQDAKDIEGDDWQKIAMKILEVSGLTKEAREEAEKN
jgi:hypothetical protein